MWEKDKTMPRGTKYPKEFRERIVELYRGGRTTTSLQQEYGCHATTIGDWVRQAERDAGSRSDRLTTEEKTELSLLRRENARLREERDILKKSRGLVCTGKRGDAQAAFRFVKANQAMHSISTMCT